MVSDFGATLLYVAQGGMLSVADNQNETILYAQIDMIRTQQVRDIWPFLRDRRIESYDCLLERYCDKTEHDKAHDLP